MYCWIPPKIVLSAACMAGASPGMIDGNKNSKLDFLEVRRGRNAWRTAKGARRRVLSTSDHAEGLVEAIDLAGRADPGSNIKAARFNIWEGTLVIGV